MTEQTYEAEQKYIDIQQTFEMLKYDLDAIRMSFDPFKDYGTSVQHRVFEQALHMLEGHINDLKQDCIGW